MLKNIKIVVKIIACLWTAALTLYLSCACMEAATEGGVLFLIIMLCSLVGFGFLLYLIWSDYSQGKVLEDLKCHLETQQGKESQQVS